MRSVCFLSDLIPRPDPRMLEAGGKPAPASADIVLFTEANRHAFEAATETRGSPI